MALKTREQRRRKVHIGTREWAVKVYDHVDRFFSFRHPNVADRGHIWSSLAPIKKGKSKKVRKVSE